MEVKYGKAERLIRRSRRNHGYERWLIEKKIRRFLSDESNPAREVGNT